MRSSSSRYSTKLNIEAETAAEIARTMILPAAARHFNGAEGRRPRRAHRRDEPLLGSLFEAIQGLEKANDHPDTEGLEHAKYMRDTVIPAMTGVREVVDKLNRIAANDLWPLPKYSEVLFIK